MFKSVYNLRRFNFAILSKMKKSKNANEKPPKVTENPINEFDSAISVDKSGQIMLRIHATPGSKKSAIQSMDQNEINVSLAARPVDGQANKELLEFMTSSLSLRKTEIEFAKGAKSRSKILLINSDRFDVNEIRKRIEEQINS